MGCLVGIVRLVFGLCGKLILAAVIGYALTRLDDFFERRGGAAHHAWRTYRTYRK